MTGGLGADTFVLGGGIFRSGGVGPYYGGGNSDYALITDFNKSEDVLELAGISYNPNTGIITNNVEYSLGASPSGLPQGTGIFVTNLSAEPSLIAILQGVSPDSLSLSESYFTFRSNYG